MIEPKSFKSVIEALNFYSNNFSFEHSKEWVCFWAKTNIPELDHQALLKVKPHRFSNLGFIVRIHSRNSVDIDSSVFLSIRNKLKELVHEQQPPQKEENLDDLIITEVPPNQTIEDLEYLMDDILNNKETNISITLPESAKQKAEVKLFLEKRIKEYQDLSEKYNRITAFFKEYHENNIGQLIKQPRKRNEKSVSQHISQPVSSSRDAINGASRCVVINSKYRSAFLYVAKDGMSLALRGNVIDNWDETLSRGKTMRKLEEFMGSSKPFLVFDSFAGSERKMMTRLTEDSIVLKTS